jgi:hypothetical protein
VHCGDTHFALAHTNPYAQLPEQDFWQVFVLKSQP